MTHSKQTIHVYLRVSHVITVQYKCLLVCSYGPRSLLHINYIHFYKLIFCFNIILGPIQEVSIRDQCAQRCTVSNKFNYEAGTTYEFTYETDVRTAIQGASEDHAGVHLTSNVYLDFVSQCEMVLRVSY